MKLHIFLALGLWIFAGAVFAQQAPHVCGAGPGPNETMAGVQPAGPGVAPTPLCYWKSGAQQQAAPQPSGYWEKTWGAIATSETGGALGTALGASSESEAKRSALADCKAKGGGGCDASFAFHNQCAVAVIGSRTFRMYGAASIDQATADGMKDCAAANGDESSCRVYYSACTKPIFHKY